MDTTKEQASAEACKILREEYIDDDYPSVRTKNPYGTIGKPVDPALLAKSKKRIGKAMKEAVKEFNRKQSAQR